MLALTQLSLVGALVVGWWAIAPSPVERDPLAARLAALDTHGAMVAVDQALASAQRRGGMVASRRAGEAAFLGLVAEGAGLTVTSVEWSEGPDEGAPVAVHASVRFQGDAYGLPALVDGVHRQQDAVRITRLDADVAATGQVDARLGLLFLRPATADATRVAEAAAFHMPADPDLPQLLSAALELTALRQFDARAAGQRAAAESERALLMRGLPGPLVALRRSGGRLRWSPGSDIEARSL